MRTRSIFNLFDSLNRAHFKLQNESLFVSFTHWVQIQLTCEIDEVAREFRNFIRFSSNPEASRGIFLKKFTSKLVKS